MSYYSCGEAIRRARMHYGLTQEELAYGVCAVSSLSKIENGKQVPHYLTFEALMQKMGEPCESVPYYITAADLSRRRILQDIEQDIWRGDAESLKHNFDCYRQSTVSENLLEYQWTCLIEQLLLFWGDGETERIREETAHIVEMTLPEFRERLRPGTRHTHCELVSILLVGVCEQRLGNYEQAAEIYRHLRQYVRFVSCDRWLDDLNDRICYHMSRLLSEKRDPKGSARLCRKGIENCLKREKYHMAARLMSLMLHNAAEWDENVFS